MVCWDAGARRVTGRVRAQKSGFNLEELLFGPAEHCSRILEENKLATGKVYHELCTWGCAVMKEICIPWDDCVKHQKRSEIDLKARVVLRAFHNTTN